MALWVPATSRAATCEPSIAKAMAVEGKVDVRRPPDTQWQPVKLHDTFCPGDMIRVQERSRADIALSNQPMLRLDQHTTMTLGGVKKEGGSLVELTKGAMHFFSRLPRNLDIKTAFVNAGVEGTEGVVVVGDDQAEVTIFEGKVVAANESGTLNITNGQSVVAVRGKAPAYQTVVKPRDAVQWALHYPPVIDRKAGEAGDAQSFTSHAVDALAVGRVDEAKADLDRALKADPRSADALALQSIIAVVQNDKEQALGLATSAVAANPQSASAKIALSYAQQAHFDVEGALKSLQEAVKAEPGNVLAWSRLAEMHLSLQQLDEGLEAAKKAVALNPEVERAHTVLGFAYLLQVKTKEARAEFEKAHELDQAAALPQLGLGLAKFRDGHIEEGRREMEVAASLDPNNAMIRSYLGKAYFEEKNTELTSREYQNAKELDPKDPTPFFYDALHKQLTNRPIEALEDMETAIDLNKNRAVYRSQLQMDSDAAARSASLARIYSNLGFEQVALIEGWTSVNRDQTSFTAHRFLADSYATLPRHEIARVSELLQSQLLQPLNITPIQPSLAVSNLFLLSALGPNATSFNEFNSLMVNRDRLTFLGSGLYGSNNGLGSGEGMVAGIYRNISFSAGVSGFHNDGWRQNADQHDMNANAFVQVELSPRTSIQGEYRYRNLQRGDVQQRFLPENLKTGLNIAEVRHTGRVGARHEFDAHSMVIANVMYTRSSEQETEHYPNQPRAQLGPFLFPVSFGQLDGKANPLDAYQAEAQYLLQAHYFNFVAGGGYAHVNGSPLKTDNCVDPTALFPSLGRFFCNPAFYRVPINGDMRHINGYGYGYFKPLNNLTITAGGSYDYLDGPSDSFFVPGGKSVGQFNPKFGMVFNPFPSTTIRAAAFRTLKRTLITDQTIEPTQVGGFNQFFDDFNATDGWRYAFGVNQKFSHNVYGGFEISTRQLTTPTQPTVGSTQNVNVEGDDHTGMGYLFYAPHPWVALRGEYRYQQINNDVVIERNVPKNLQTHRVPIGIGLFHPSGWFANATVTWWYQDANVVRLNTNGLVKGNDSWLLTDMALGYRFPKRYGMFTVGVKNLFDQKFNYFETDVRNVTIQPDRMVFAQMTLALP